MRARDALRDADRAFQETLLPAESLARLRRRVLAGPSRAPWLVVAAAAAAAVIAAVVLWPQARVEDVSLVRAERYGHGRFEISANAASLLHRDGDELTLMRGDVEVNVQKRRSERVRLRVSHGFIEVVGTRFTLRQREDGGDVTLHEGVIHFVGAGDTHVMSPGETYAWPPVALVAPPREPPLEPAREPEPAPEPPASTAKPRLKSLRREPAVIREIDAAWLLAEVDTARSRGEYAEAVRLLDKGLAGIVSGSTKERFSFELGSILTWQLADARACKHWQKHAAAFPNGRYAQQIVRAMEKANCAP